MNKQGAIRGTLTHQYPPDIKNKHSKHHFVKLPDWYLFLHCTHVLTPSIITFLCNLKGKKKKKSQAQHRNSSQLGSQYCIFTNMLPFIFFIPLYKALDTNQSPLYKHCFLENTKGVAVKSSKYCTKQHGMTDTERCGTLRVSLCKCLY